MRSAEFAEPETCWQYRIAIGEAVGQDIADRIMDGSNPNSVRFRAATLRSIAFAIPDRTGDARDIRELTYDELRAYIARQLDFDDEGRDFRWHQLKRIYEVVSE